MSDYLETIDASWYTRPPGVRPRTSAGGIVVRQEETGQIWVALVGEAVGDMLVLPKGGIKKSETFEQAARREIEEEAGFTDLVLRDSLGTRERLSFDRRRWITTHYFLFETGQTRATPTDPKHLHSPTWLPLDDDFSAVFWPEQRDLITSSREAIRRTLSQKNSSQGEPNAVMPERVTYYVRHGLAATPIVLQSLCAGLTPEELDRKPDPDRFTLREALCHLADWEGVWKERLERIASEDNPLLPGYDEGQWAIDHDYAHADADEQITRFVAGRKETLKLLESLPADAWNRSGVHGEIGPITLSELAALVLGHDGYHLRQIVEFRDAK